MAIVVVLVGQCGNQLGDELFTQLALCTGLSSGSTPTSKAGTAASQSPAFSPFFTRDGMARCVLVDTEPKVVLGVRQRHADFMRADNVVHGQSGRGNNWGLGYHGVKTLHSRRNEDNAAVQRAFRNIARDQREEDDNVLGKALQAIYRETRRTSDADVDGSGSFEAIVIVHSLVGGTGSGLASRLTERLRLYFTEPPPGQRVDEVYEATMMRIDGFDGGLYGAQRRARHLINVAVAPQVVGEVATQGLNASLTLQVLQKHSDAILLLRNDDAMAPGASDGRCSSSVCAGTSILSRCVTFKEANEVLVALLLPVLRYGLEPGCITHLLMQCVPPAYAHTTGGNKILTLLPTPQRSYATLRQCAHRVLFCVVEGGRAFMPGYVPTVPVEELLSKTASRLYGQLPRRGSKTGLKYSTKSNSGSCRTGRVAPRSFATSTGAAKGKLTPTLQTRRPPPPSPLSSAEDYPTLTRMRFAEDVGSATITNNNTAELSFRCGNDGTNEAQRRLSVRQRQRQRLGFRAADEGGVSRPLMSSAEGPFTSSSSSTSAVSRRRPPVTPFSSASPTRACPRVQPAARAATRRVDYSQQPPEDLEEEEAGRAFYGFDSAMEDGASSHTYNDGDEGEEDLNRRVFQQCSTKIPPPLYQHYLQLRRAPVTKMLEAIDGVLLLNEALELDRKVLFPMLRSAALKVSTGAFMSSYEDVGVTSERVKRAIRDVAEIMANSEEL